MCRNKQQITELKDGKRTGIFCFELFNKILKVPITEEDIKKFAILGKADLAQQETAVSAQQRKARPVLIQFRDRILKNMIMEFLLLHSYYTTRDANVPINFASNIV